jgi:hypothetical protein
MSDQLSKIITCGHCYNIAKMEIAGGISDTVIERDPDNGPCGEFGTIYQVLKCPACGKVNIISFGWHDMIESDDEIRYEVLYPHNTEFPIGLPQHILKALQAAERVKPIDVNAYVILLRRLLELVCIDRHARGDNLATMLQDLANKKEIPEKLVHVAKGLKDFGNLGAHAGSGELSENEIPIVKALCEAILEYVYSAAHLASLAENKLQEIKAKKQQ